MDCELIMVSLKLLPGRNGQNNPKFISRGYQFAELEWCLLFSIPQSDTWDLNHSVKLSSGFLCRLQAFSGLTSQHLLLSHFTQEDSSTWLRLRIWGLTYRSPSKDHGFEFLKSLFLSFLSLQSLETKNPTVTSSILNQQRAWWSF